MKVLFFRRSWNIYFLLCFITFNSFCFLNINILYQLWNHLSRKILNHFSTPSRGGNSMPTHQIPTWRIGDSAFLTFTQYVGGSGVAFSLGFFFFLNIRILYRTFNHLSRSFLNYFLTNNWLLRVITPWLLLRDCVKQSLEVSLWGFH